MITIISIGSCKAGNPEKDVKYITTLLLDPYQIYNLNFDVDLNAWIMEYDYSDQFDPWVYDLEDQMEGMKVTCGDSEWMAEIVRTILDDKYWIDETPYVINVCYYEGIGYFGYIDKVK